MEPFLAAVLATLITSFISFVGALFLAFRINLEKSLHHFVSFAVGAMLAVAFLDLLPEALELQPVERVFAFVLVGFLSSFVLEKFLYWHHHHHHAHGKKEKDPCQSHPDDCHVVKSYTYLNIFGDGIHNFLDGAIIGAAFIADTAVGIATTVGVILHEIPQEMGDFAILLKGGFSKKKALFYNFLSAITAVAGTFMTFLFANKITSLTGFLLPFAAGVFIYLIAVDILPELHKEGKLSANVLQLVLILLGIFTMVGVGTLAHG